MAHVLATGSRSACAGPIAERVLAAWYDLNALAAGPEALHFVSLFDDTADVWTEEDFKLVEPLSVVTRWSRQNCFSGNCGKRRRRLANRQSGTGQPERRLFKDSEAQRPYAGTFSFDRRHSLTATIRMRLQRDGPVSLAGLAWLLLGKVRVVALADPDRPDGDDAIP